MKRAGWIIALALIIAYVIVVGGWWLEGNR